MNTNNYLAEAFKDLKALDEDAFQLTPEGINDLSELENDNENEDDSILVIDPDAESEDDLQTSYIGKVIVQCQVCESLVYKDPSEITISEDSNLANEDEECPFCYSTGGFKIVGEVASYTKVDAEPEVVDTDEVEIEDTEPIQESAPKKVSHTNRKMRRDFRSSNYIEEAKTFNPVIDVKKDIRKAMAKLSSKKPYENFGQAEIRELKDKYSDFQYGEHGEVFKLINSFDDWCQSYTGTMDESFDGVTIDTGDQKIQVKAEDTDVKTTDTQIEPVSDETKDKIENDEFTDVDVDDFDEDSFDDLSEKYLKEIYDNVDSYKTSSVKRIKNKLTLEGTIKFKSGTEKKTEFVFESLDINKSGRIRFVGENCQIAKGRRKAFIISGNVQDKKFISEKFNYNYRAKNPEDGKSTRVYGTIKLK